MFGWSCDVCVESHDGILVLNSFLILSWSMCGYDSSCLQGIVRMKSEHMHFIFFSGEHNCWGGGGGGVNAPSPESQKTWPVVLAIAGSRC